MASIPSDRLMLVTIALSTLLLTACLTRSESSQDSPEPLYQHRVSAIRVNVQQRYQAPRVFTGVVNARQSADLGFEQGGKLTRIQVDEGAHVARGAALAELDTALLEREHDELQARVKETEAQRRLVEQNLARIEDLNKKGFASAREQDELLSQRRVLNASLERLAAALAANRTRRDKAILYAPFDATVSRRYADTGAVVNAGIPVLRLLQNNAPEARIGLPSRFLAQVQLDQVIELETQEQTLTGQIIAINPELDPITRTVAVRFALPADAAVVDGNLIAMPLPETINQRGFWLPMSALTDGLRGLWNVYVLQAEEGFDQTERFRLEARDVQIEYADTERAYVSGALADDELIIEAGLHRLAPGQIVRLGLVDSNSALAGR